MNFTTVIDPYNDPYGFCGVFEGAIQSHYQGLLSTYWGVFLLGGFVVGFLVGFMVTVWWMHRNVKKT